MDNSTRKRNKKKPTAIDVFSGCGGTTKGLREAGFRVIAGIECDSLAVRTYRENHRGVKVWEDDVTEIAIAPLLRHHKLRKGELDLLVGCPPCQAFSAIRRLNGNRIVRRKTEKDLVFEFMRLVRGLFPKVVMLENVPRLMNDYRFQSVKSELRKLGYEGEPQIFNAADFGVPQRRRRLVYVASRIGVIDCRAVVKVDRRTVRDAIGKLKPAGKSGDPLHDIPENRTQAIVERIANVPKDGGSRSDLGDAEQLECHKSCDGFKDVYGRMAWDAVAPTITGGCFNPSKGRFLHPEENRAITLREAALLQSFPSDYFFSLDEGKCAAAQMIGNAFPPAFVQHHAESIREKLVSHSPGTRRRKAGKICRTFNK